MKKYTDVIETEYFKRSKCKLLDSDPAQNYVPNATYSRLENCPLKTIEIKVVDK